MECVTDCNIFWLVLRANSTTMTKCSALECCLYTFAFASATFVTTTSQRFSTSLCSFWQSCPVYFPTIWLLPSPAPITRRWNLWSCNHYLAPAVTSLVSCPLSVLYESCLCRGNTFYWSYFLCKELHPGLVDAFQVTGAVIQQYHKPLQGFNKTLHRLWVGRQRTKCWCNVIVGFPSIPCSSLTSSSKKRNRITISKSMKHLQCHTPIRPQSSGCLMSCYKMEAFSGSKSNPYLSVVKALSWCHYQYYHISVNCTYGNFRISLFHKIFQM